MMLSIAPIASTPLASLPLAVRAGDSIAATCPVFLQASQPELVFQLLGRASLQLSASASLSIHIELSASAALQLAAQAAELTIGYQLGGTVTEMGIPVARTIRVYDAATGALVGQGSSAEDTGAYCIDLLGYGEPVYVQCLGSATYGPLIHGPVTPDGR